MYVYGGSNRLEIKDVLRAFFPLFGACCTIISFMKDLIDMERPLRTKATLTRLLWVLCLNLHNKMHSITNSRHNIDNLECQRWYAVDVHCCSVSRSWRAISPASPCSHSSCQSLRGKTEDFASLKNESADATEYLDDEAIESHKYPFRNFRGRVYEHNTRSKL